MKPLIIGDLIIKTPVIQGGMGIGISRENLASAVSNAGGLGVISGINIGYDEEGFNKDPLSTNHNVEEENGDKKTYTKSKRIIK